MLKKKLLLILIFGVLIFNAAIAQAQKVYLEPETNNIGLGDTFDLQLWMDFTADPTLGGGVDVFYPTSLLGEAKFQYNPDSKSQPFYRGVNGFSYLLGEIDSIGFGHENGLAGPDLIGTLSFKAIGAGTGEVTLKVNDTWLGEFYSATSYEVQNVVYNGATINIAGENVVPEPISAFLFLFGMGGLGVCKKKLNK